MTPATRKGTIVHFVDPSTECHPAIVLQRWSAENLELAVVDRAAVVSAQSATYQRPQYGHVAYTWHAIEECDENL